ncbi:hypothetical protein A3Q56_08175, partial [Intoshia linei]
MYNDNYTPLEVRRKMINDNRSKNVVIRSVNVIQNMFNFLENNTDYNKNMSNCGKTNKKSLKVTAWLCGISKTSIWKILKKETTIRYRFLMEKPNLNQKHKETRVKYCKEMITNNTDWENVWFSDEK